MPLIITLDHCLDDVESRFLYSLPDSELQSPDRLFFQIEQAWWFYEDFFADKYTHLPHFKSLMLFAEKVFEHCPLLHSMQAAFQELFSDFSAYKSGIPVYGCILLSPDMKKILLVCNWKGKSWGFPKGKVNENETPLNCALRETFEECGFDPTPHTRAEDSIVDVQDTKKTTLFIATNVPESTAFSPQTRKEISKCEFHPIEHLPKNCFGIYPFLPKLKRWIAQNRRAAGAGGGGKAGAGKKERRLSSKASTSSAAANMVVTAIQKHPSGKAFDGRNTATFGADLKEKGWAVDDMFAANSQLTGRDYRYDGNPHAFGASHPTYRNYNSSGGVGGVGAAGTSKSADLTAKLQLLLNISTSSAGAGQQGSRGAGGTSADGGGAGDFSEFSLAAKQFRLKFTNEFKGGADVSNSSSPSTPILTRTASASTTTSSKASTSGAGSSVHQPPPPPSPTRFSSRFWVCSRMPKFELDQTDIMAAVNAILDDAAINTAWMNAIELELSEQ